MPGVGLVWDLLAKDQASPAFLRVAGAADKAAASTARASAGLSSTAARMGKVGATLTKRVTLPLAALAAVSVDQAAKYQKSLTTIAVVTDQTAKQMQASSKGLERIATSTGTSLGQLTDGLYTVEKGGFRGAKALAVVKAAAQGAKAENVDLGIATSALTSIMASYGKALKDPVAAENLIIKGSGLAKTTMSDFANSLSNVVPVAASLHVSFAQVAAAIATMTQHGETAQHATENLRNLITNLAGQNNVAAGAMNQLGINTISVSKNLGRRGLTGTLDYVLGRVSKLNHNGLITVDVFKKSALATSSLHKMLATMNPDLKKTSEGLLKGSTSIKDYQKYAKDLGGRAGASALQFLSLFKSSRGFSDLIKSGKGNVLTYATALQKMLGGVTGMNTALQLTGESAKTFHRNAEQIGAAAKHTGGDVLGWAQTQGTLSTKLDKAKASLQVMAVELGTALIPAVSKLADLGSRVAHWFDGLSGTQKKVLGWSLGVMAALGPVLTIGSRLAIVGGGIAKFASNAAQRISSLAGASEATATRVGAITRRMVAGVSGALAGAVAGQIGGNSSGGWLASIMLGTAGGWALSGGNPVGAAIGAVSAAITKGIGLWNDHKNAAKQAAVAEKAWVDSLTNSINADNGALGNNIKISIEKSLQSKGILDQAQKLGVSLADVVAASMGDKGALGRSIDNPAGRLVAKMNADLANLRDHPHMTDTQAAPINAEIQSLNKQIEAYGRLRQAITGTSGDVGKAKAQYAQTIHALDDSRVATGAFATQLAALKRTSTIAIDANGQLNRSLNATAPIGQHNRSILTDLSAAALADANNTFAAARKHHDYGQALQIATGKLGGNISALERQAVKAGFSKEQVDSLITSLHLYSGLRPAAQLRLNTGPARDDINAFIASLPTITVNADVRARVGQGSSTYRSQVPGKKHGAVGGTVPGSGNTDSVPYMLMPGEEIIRKGPAAKHRGLLKAINAGRLRGMANGGTVGSPPPIKHVGKDWIVGGVRYASERAAKNAQERAAKASSSKLGSAVGALKAFLSPSNLRDVSTSRSQFGTLIGDVRAAGGSNKLIQKLKAENRDLEAAINKRMKDTDRLKKAQQILSDVSQATKQGFDVTSAGADVNGRVSFGGFKAQQIQQKNIINRWAADLRKIGKVFGGSPAGRAMLLNLAQAGPSSFPQVEALAHAGPAALRSIVSTQQQIDRTAASIGGYISTVETGGTIAQHKRTVEHDTKQVEHDAAVMGKALLHAFPQIKWTLEIDSRGIATLVAQGNRRNHRKGAGR